MEEYVIIVDEKDQELGSMEKMRAHRMGLMHRAFSIFIFNESDELLLQRRALSKYHSGGLWTNTCCSHPRVGESLEEATSRRLMEEMGMKAEMTKAFDFTYYKALDKGLVEHEFDHVFIGHTNEEPVINPEEVEEYKYVSISEVLNNMKSHPEQYTEWFKICFPKVVDQMATKAA